jgi:hypothetical protein
MALGYLVPLVCFAGVGLYGFVAPLVTPHEVRMSPEALKEVAGGRLSVAG